MKIVSFRAKGHSSWGVTANGGIVDAPSRFVQWPTVRHMLEADGLGQLAGLADAAPDHALDAIEFEPPIGNPDKIICVGLNYVDHVSEMQRTPQAHPLIFARSTISHVAHEQPLILPPESECFDYEGELALIVGKRSRRVAPQDAFSIIAGYACYNDGSIRDYQRQTTQYHPGKNWPRSGAFGPYLVTPDEVGDLPKLKLETRLNGQVVQSARFEQLIFDIPTMIAAISVWTELLPGDVIVTGTPGGVGVARTPPLWMKAGDVVEVEIERVGLLRNTVQAETV
jgi:2-keto-4-pentenoate hydratase/2-oxohepta-3-ene-1,7-dioic acid hydratase in catechol pathway